MEKALQNFVSIYHPEYAQNERGTKDFHVSFYGLPEVDKLRELMTDKIGQLVSVSGTVTRTSEVRPELVYGHFKCNECGYDVPNVEQQFKFVWACFANLPTVGGCTAVVASCTLVAHVSPNHCRGISGCRSGTPSLQPAATQNAKTSARGNLIWRRVNSWIGSVLSARKTLRKFQRVVCHEAWTSLCAMKQSNS